MKENTRRLVLFAVIVGTGSVMIFMNIPLIVLLLLIIAVCFLLMVLLGSITVAGISTAVSKLTLKNLRQKPALKKRNSTELSGKGTSAPKDTGERKTGKSAPAKPKETAHGIRAHLRLLVSSINSLGKIITEQRKKPAKNPEEINKLLEHTITEKVSRVSALESAATVPAGSGSNRAGAGGVQLEEDGMESDPFLTLSGEELETGLLDGLYEEEPAPEPHPAAPAHAGTDPALSMTDLDLDMPALPDETAVDARAILNANADNGSEEPKDLDGVNAIDEALGDLGSINLDDIDFGDDIDMPEPTPPAPVSPTVDTTPGSSGFTPETPVTPAGESGSTADDNQGEISSFAAGSAARGVDDDMLSSLATEIKHMKKERDHSLLRELKDFKAPATDIEMELSEVAEQLATVSKGAKKKIPSPQGIK